MAEAKRMANIELLRILAMVMVVVMHFLSHSGNLVETESPLSSVKVVGTLLEMFCIFAVNTYVFISGYFGVHGSFKPGKALAFLFQIWFYAIFVFLVLAAAGIPTAGYDSGSLRPYGLIQYFFPIETEHYWFATSYFVLYLFSPLLQRAAKSLTKKQFQITLAGLLLLFSLVKSFSPVLFSVDHYGYDPLWFFCVYLTAAYCSLHGAPFFEKRGWTIYVLSALTGFGIQMVLWVLSQRNDGFKTYFTVPYHYNFIFSLTGAMGLFYGFSRISIQKEAVAEAVRRVGRLSFGVYLLHEHLDLRTRWYGWLGEMANPQGKEGLFFFLWELLFCTGILFAAGILIDWLRSLLFRAAGASLKKTKAGRKLKELDGYFISG